MVAFSRWNTLPSVLLLSFMLSACGGHNGPEYENGGTGSSSSQATAAQLAAEPGAPALSGNTATDAFNWYNFRRQQVGLPVLVRKSTLDTSAQKHADYMSIFGNATHVETDQTNPYFTGTRAIDRMIKAGYVFQNDSGFNSEVLSGITNNTSGFFHAEALVMAVFHRFAIFEPTFSEAGAGFSTAKNGWTYVNMDMASPNGLGPGLTGTGNVMVTYPFSGQQNVPRNFFSNTEDPDPIPGKDEVGYPITVHANADVTLDTTTFEVRKHGDSSLLAATRVEFGTHADGTISSVPESAACIIPDAPLLTKTTYDVKYVGNANAPSIDGQTTVTYPINRSWSFTTR